MIKENLAKHHGLTLKHHKTHGCHNPVTILEKSLDDENYICNR